MTDFSRVLLAHDLASSIFSAAAQEKLLFTRSAKDGLPQVRRSQARQRALTLLVLFDRIILHELGEGDFRLPDLENDGIVEVIPLLHPESSAKPIRSSWRRGSLKHHGKPRRSLLQTLRVIE